MRSELACRWLRKAEKDLKAAERLLDEPDYSAFHSQQAAEKALKAILVFAGVQPPRTHNIGVLISRLSEMGLVTESIESARILTDYAVRARYPDFEDEVTEEEALEALSLARRVVEWARRVLREKGVDCREPRPDASLPEKA